ncbi:sensor histidine kinase [Amorphoplanes digitatis]|uniref:histidine kinase n=1 Tax=Actinoplanes digitatis TaxID=1868 RepID=A0A7W7HV15_9ACTN|nr:sensor histidine kinase [Actinoplanes digitatis]MBB4761311.1 signal transduction histidine kinase [Actinoplanes digitatis]GID92927.1 histidine kinase [Actinoplanes digitatis]
MIVLRAWLTARTWRELGYLLTGVLVAAPTFALGLLSIVAVGSSTVPLGLPILAGVLAVARLTPRWFRGHARYFLGRSWDDPPPLPAGTLWRRSLALFRDAAAWRALGYCLARWPLTVAGAYPAALALVVGPAAVTYPLWWFAVPADLGAFDTDSWARTWLVALEAAATLLVVPWWMRLIVWTDGLLVRALLQPSRSQRRIAELEAGRTALRADAAALLRRIERDLHDGTQARLVTLGVALSRIEHRSTEEAVRTLAADARGTVTEALAELRDIVRGMHPPALDDGLDVALTTLAGRSAVPAEVTVALDARPPDATASALYFAVAELLTNVARHAHAGRVRIDLRTDGSRLRLTVTDDGRGGARIDSTGTGLAGLARRASALDGALTVDSPPGGPTTVTMTLPVEA